MIAQSSATAGMKELPFGSGVSNLSEGYIPPGLAEELKAGPVFSRHAAWNFNGLVWWDGFQFCEEVWVYHEIQEVAKADTLEALVSAVNDKYGSD